MKISVCMATYNGEKYICNQVESILQQLGSNDELVISDDHSTDSTIEILKGLNDSRIKILVNDYKNKGYTKNFENALKNSSGDIIFLSDQDDIWVEGKVVCMLSELENSDMVISNAEIVNANLEPIHPSHFELYKVRKGFINNFMKTRYIGACMAFRKDVLRKALPFPNNQLYCAHDYWLTIIGEAYFKVVLEEKPLLKYRRHSNNASSGGEGSKNSFFKKIIVRIYSMYNLIKRINK